MTKLTHDEVKALDNFFNTFFSAAVSTKKHKVLIESVKKLTEKICARQFSDESAVAKGGNGSSDEGESTCTGSCSSDSDQTSQSMFKTTNAKSQKSKLPTHKDVPSQIDTLCIPKSKKKVGQGKFTQHCQEHNMTTEALRAALHRIDGDENARAWITLKLFLRKLKSKPPADYTKKAFYHFLDKSIGSISREGSVDQGDIPALVIQFKHKKGRFFRFFQSTMTRVYLSNFLGQFTKNPSTYSKRLSARLSTIFCNTDRAGFPIVHAINGSQKEKNGDGMQRGSAVKNPFSSDSNPFSSPSSPVSAKFDSSGTKENSQGQAVPHESTKEAQASDCNDRPEVPARGIAAGANSNNNAPEPPFVLNSAFLLPGDDGYIAPADKPLTDKPLKYVPGQIRFNVSKEEQTEQETAKQNAEYAVHDFPAYLKKHWRLFKNPSSELLAVLNKDSNFLGSLGLQVESGATETHTKAPPAIHPFFGVRQNRKSMHRQSGDMSHFLSTFDPWIKKRFGKRIDRSRAAAIALVLTPSLLSVSSGAITPLLASGAWIMAPIITGIALGVLSLLILTASCKHLCEVYASKDSIFNKAAKMSDQLVPKYCDL